MASRIVSGALAALAAVSLASGLAGPASAAEPVFRFASIDGGVIDLAEWRGSPVLVVNTASLCGFTSQYDDLQALHVRYQARGLKVLAVPSDDFRQELADAAEVKEFCETNFNLTIPMTDITPVKGAGAHPFYGWLQQAHGFVPSWNFNKVLIGPDGALVGTWGSLTKPGSRAITDRIDALLP
ncbi:glutathione peroxidase [Paracoccaceae bacterium Fryx2]|nr:glutathione peroxidase [Paracoccaceae bacterium Fryx2]